MLHEPIYNYYVPREAAWSSFGPSSIGVIRLGHVLDSTGRKASGVLKKHSQKWFLDSSCLRVTIRCIWRQDADDFVPAPNTS
jgi:hypothetical protein